MSSLFTSDWDRKMTKDMAAVLMSFDMFETSADREHKEQVVKNLEALFQQWVTEICRQKNVPESILERVGGRVLPFGSHPLGSQGKGGDIDVVCVGPGFIERREFFTSFSEKLKTLKEVQELQVHEEAFVPIINLVFDGVEVDLLFARVMRESISEQLDLTDTTLLDDMDQRCIRSLSGYRNTVDILQLVPNIYTFRAVLKVIKHWAKCRNIYSNKLGFLGGINFAILLARVCQLYPNASPATLVANFFVTYSTWEWPTPVMLKDPEHHRMDLPVWDPSVNPSDGLHKMPIISSAYPHMNTAYNVTESTRQILMDEFRRGRDITEAIFGDRASWEELFKPDNFFNKYRHYIVLKASAGTKAHLEKWEGFIEAKIRILVGYLDRNVNITVAQPYIRSFPGTGGLYTKWLIGFTVDQYASKILNLDRDFKNFRNFVYKQSRHWHKDGMVLSAWFSKQSNLGACVPIPDVGQSSDSSLTPTCEPSPAQKRPQDSEPASAPKRVRLDQTPSSGLDSNPSSKSPSLKRPRDPEPAAASKKTRADPSPPPANVEPTAETLSRFDWTRFKEIRSKKQRKT